MEDRNEKRSGKTCGKWAAKKKKKGANDQEAANVEEVSNVIHVQEVVGKHLHQPLALHFRADNLFMIAFF